MHSITDISQEILKSIPNNVRIRKQSNSFTKLLSLHGVRLTNQVNQICHPINVF